MCQIYTCSHNKLPVPINTWILLLLSFLKTNLLPGSDYTYLILSMNKGIAVPLMNSGRLHFLFPVSDIDLFLRY